MQVQSLYLLCFCFFIQRPMRFFNQMLSKTLLSSFLLVCIKGSVLCVSFIFDEQFSTSLEGKKKSLFVSILTLETWVKPLPVPSIFPVPHNCKNSNHADESVQQHTQLGTLLAALLLYIVFSQSARTETRCLFSAIVYTPSGFQVGEQAAPCDYCRTKLITF
jgi:hypothetical protein